MSKFFSFIIRQSVAIVLIVAFVLAMGVYSALNMSINLLPDINVPMVCVQVIYPGANASSVEKDVTENLEEGLSSLSGVTSVDSYSYDNLSAVVLSFDYGTDTKAKQSDITSRLNSSISLPDGVSWNVYDIDLNAEALAVLSVTSSQGLDDAYSKGKQLAARLAAIDGVENVEIKGGAEYSYFVRTLGGFEQLAPVIVEAFSYGALDLPLGNAGDIQIRNNSDVKSEDDIKNMPIVLPVEFCAAFDAVRQQIKKAGIEAMLPPTFKFDIDIPTNAQIVVNLYFNQIKEAVHATAGGENLSDEAIKFIILNKFTDEEGNIVEKTVSVADIATVGVESSYSSYAYYYDGKVNVTPGVALEIYKSNGANSSAVVKEVKSVYGDISSQQGYTASIALLDDQSEFISESINNVLISMLIGGVLAVLVIFVFLKKVRTSLIIAVTMPLSVLAAIILLYLMGITLNMVSLGGLAVGIGMLVDNSIVVIEAITKHRDMDKTAFCAAVDGTVEVGGALFGSTLTTVCVFIPIIFTGGLTGEIFTDLAWAVIWSLAFSLIVAVTVIPALYSLLSGGKGMLKGGRFGKRSQKLPAAQTADTTVTAEQAETTQTAESVQTTQTAESVQMAQVAETAQTADTNAAEAASSKKVRKTFRQRLAALKEPRIMDGITAFYGKLLPKALKRKIVPILSAVVVFGASIGLLFLRLE